MAGNRDSCNRCVWQETVNRDFERVGREVWSGNQADLEEELYKSMGNNWAISAGRKGVNCGEVASAPGERMGIVYGRKESGGILGDLPAGKEGM